MRVRLLKKRTVEIFRDNHSNAQKHFNNWLFAIKYADWNEPRDILCTYKGNLLGNDRVVFDIGGNGQNAFRMICTFVFLGNTNPLLYVNWIGSHEEYNHLTPEFKMTVWDF